MGEQISALEIQIGGFHLEIPQSILVWFCLCILFAIFFYVAGKKIDQADPSKKPTGVVYVAEEMLNAIMYVIKPNLREKTLEYLPIFGTLFFMMIVSNLMGLLGLQNPTSNVSFNGTLALSLFVMVQFYGIKKAGLVSRLKEWAQPFWFLYPLNLIGEVAPVISLTMRLFGNMLAGYIIMMLVYTLMKITMPWGVLGYIATPFLHMYFDCFSAFIQSFIFFTLGSYFLGEQVAPTD
ncbi:MAG: F0F1 ATP synthase subunit A [Absicoccus porci]|jgi:F-type H+-transporting ATPase subunit a|uniref:ATP synthase subunit a n=1 Tax=Absicoccus porci TaxID=2486576 RepID=A0A3N0HZH0_9FIRM|nr:F0F1 ATP synthase subunit A [Absicoccus porci]MCI6087211.1 F0F1 ATP synthase subunit A [Absicoccus porci]MDD6459990.1 F0F1 ATP synthase subunit A [Absicoccus porci]MDD7329896.1 F0F1 ATP synthase subunit A [Absicoccus porci]MDY4737822.1 F0F1 ATP synthase subunit A [Absicoccus porci]MEE1355913.1 F0F1 ATP synthase subunit A [Absicoccus porci]